MRDKALVCLLDIRDLCYPVMEKKSLKEWVINPYFEQLLFVFSDECVRRQFATIEFSFFIFGQSQELDLSENIYSYSASKDVVTITLSNLREKLKQFIADCYNQLEKKTGKKHNCFYFQEPEFIILNLNDKKWSSLNKVCYVQEYRQILFISHNNEYLREASDQQCITCSVYNRDTYDQADMDHMFNDLQSINFRTIRIVLCESLKNSTHQTYLLDLFSKNFQIKKTTILFDQYNELSHLENDQEAIIFFEKNADQALSLWIWYASLTCHVVRVHEFREFNCQLTLIVNKWLAQMKNISIEQNTLRVKTSSDEFEEFDDCSGVLFKKTSTNSASIQSVSSFFGSVSDTLRNVSENLTESAKTNSSSFAQFISSRVFR